MMSSSVDFPQPLGPTRQTNSPSATCKRDVVERMHMRPSAAEPLRNAFDRKLGGRRSRTIRVLPSRLLDKARQIGRVAQKAGGLRARHERIQRIG